MTARGRARKGGRLESSAQILERLSAGIRDKVRTTDELAAAISKYSASAKPESFEDGVLVVSCGTGPERTEIALHRSAIAAVLAKKGIRLLNIRFR